MGIGEESVDTDRKGGNTQDDPPPLNTKQRPHSARLVRVRIKFRLDGAVSRNDNMVPSKLRWILNLRQQPSDSGRTQHTSSTAGSRMDQDIQRRDKSLYLFLPLQRQRCWGNNAGSVVSFRDTMI